MKYDIGIIGLGVMGRNIVLNMERNGYSVAAYDIDPSRNEEAKGLFSGKQIRLAGSIADLAGLLKSPRTMMLMVPAGKAVDAAIADIKPFLSKGDLLIDGGNSHFPDTARRWNALKSDGILFIGTGISGGEEGALWGPSIMPGGDEEAWPLVKNLFQTIAAKTEDGLPCCEWIGEGGAGHFVKMIHNGIEYGDMQMICEAYAVMKHGLGMRADEMQTVFAGWNKGELDSYLIEITGHILGKTDDRTGKPMVDVILDTAGQKGTGKWTSQSALDLGCPAPTIAEAVFARAMSAIKEERVAASQRLKGPDSGIDVDRAAFIEKIRQALYASKICSYAQGFHLLRLAAEEYEWKLNYGQIATIWRSGCIIRAQFLGRIKGAFDKDPDLRNLLLDDYFMDVIYSAQEAWRQVIARAVEHGIPVPAFSSALAYYDGYRSERLPANLLQAQRDYFGAHTYERIDEARGRFFHTAWY